MDFHICNESRQHGCACAFFSRPRAKPPRDSGVCPRRQEVLRDRKCLSSLPPHKPHIVVRSRIIIWWRLRAPTDKFLLPYNSKLPENWKMSFERGLKTACFIKTVESNVKKKKKMRKRRHLEFFSAMNMKLRQHFNDEKRSSNTSNNVACQKS